MIGIRDFSARKFEQLGREAARVRMEERANLPFELKPHHFHEKPGGQPHHEFQDRIERFIEPAPRHFRELLLHRRGGRFDRAEMRAHRAEEKDGDLIMKKRSARAPLSSLDRNAHDVARRLFPAMMKDAVVSTRRARDIKGDREKARRSSARRANSGGRNPQARG